ncbi:MAG: magnesium/cobalt transporter CorA [Gammaproteobacteria bacterium]
MLINCVAYENGRKLADITVDEISEYLERPHCFIWVALLDASPPELAQMQHEFGLHELAIEDSLKGHQRPKVEEYGDTLFAVMKVVDFVQGELQVGELDVFVGPNFVLSVRNNSFQNFLGVRQRAEREPHLLQQGAGFVFYALMDAVVDRYFPVVEALELELETLEEQIFEGGSGRSNVQGLYELKKKVTTLRHVVAPLMEATARLHSGRSPGMFENSRHYFRDVYDHLVRIQGALDSTNATIGVAMQVNLSMVTIEESETTKRLAAWAGIFAVATAFAGIWGMNFEAMPELHWRYGYPAALLVIAVSCAALYRRFRRSGWL